MSTADLVEAILFAALGSATTGVVFVGYVLVLKIEAAASNAQISKTLSSVLRALLFISGMSAIGVITVALILAKGKGMEGRYWMFLLFLVGSGGVGVFYFRKSIFHRGHSNE